jgi:hypothetical protein
MLLSVYSVRWMTKLIRRDIRGLAIDCTNEIQGLFSNNASTSTSHFQVEIEFPIDAEDLHGATSGSTTPYLASSTADDSDSIAPTKITKVTLEASNNTLYALHNNKLKELYASRDRAAPREERWIFQGT